MQVTYSWLICSCLFYGSGILCENEDSCSTKAEDNFYCSNGLCIKLSWVCDGRKDCSDGSDETKELCARYQYGPNMSMECGKVNKKNQVTSREDKATIETAPWNVLIYKLDDSSYYLSCLGSLIAPNVVISIAHVFWKKGQSKTISINDGSVKVAIGKYYRHFEIIDNLTQIIDVEMIYMPEGYNGLDGNFAEDISLLVLSYKVSFINGVSPVCIDWNSKHEVQNGAQGKILVWEDTENGTQSPVLLEKLFPFIDHSTCQRNNISGLDRYLTFDKICAGSKLVSEVAYRVGHGNSGSGISFLHSNSYFLTGVLSVLDKKYNKNTVIGLTDIKQHVKWIRGLLNNYVIENSCVLPIVEGVVYSYEGSNETLPHGALINHHLIVIENCAVGYYKAYPNGFRFCQGRGKWVSNSEKLCFKMCPPLLSDSLDIKCTLNGKYANCSNLSIPNTIATPSCKPTYTAPNGQEDTPHELHCQSNGTWNTQLQLYRCNPYCGKVYIKNEVLINNGEIALVGTAPWNVGIYKLNKNMSDYDIICGGSIIAPNLVVSAAHCFWQQGVLSKKLSISDDRYKISVGKYDRNLTIIDNDFTQIINVDIIHLKESYYGPTGFHAEDIAIIVLKSRVSFSNGVSPVCIDWNSKYNEVNGNQGKIVGWGKTEKGIPSPILLEAYLPYIDHSSCRNMYTNGFEPFVTVDKFCAGSESGQGVGRGDSGAGLCFFHSESYYLTGVASIKDPNTNNSIAVFTDVKHHIQWIRGLYNKYSYIQ